MVDGRYLTILIDHNQLNCKPMFSSSKYFDRNMLQLFSRLSIHLANKVLGKQIQYCWWRTISVDNSFRNWCTLTLDFEAMTIFQENGVILHNMHSSHSASDVLLLTFTVAGWIHRNPTFACPRGHSLTNFDNLHNRTSRHPYKWCTADICGHASTNMFNNRHALVCQAIDQKYSGTKEHQSTNFWLPTLAFNTSTYILLVPYQ